MTIPPKERIDALFDELVAEGLVIHGPHHVMEPDCGGYPMEFRLCPFLSRKPNTYGAPLGPGFNKSRKWGPGSDLYLLDDRFKLAELNGTHDLAFNLFCVDRPQFLMVTLDSYKRQDEPLDLDDCAAALQLLTAMVDFYVIFNGGQAAGCTRVHKHLQGLRGPPHAFEFFTGSEEKESKIPFRYFIHRFDEGFAATSALQLYNVYQTLLSRARETLGLPQADNACPHNVVIWKDSIIVIPRRSPAVGQRASAHSGGMLGSIWMHDHAPMEEWLKLGYNHVLTELGVPR